MYVEGSSNPERASFTSVMPGCMLGIIVTLTNITHPVLRATKIRPKCNDNRFQEASGTGEAATLDV